MKILYIKASEDVPDFTYSGKSYQVFGSDEYNDGKKILTNDPREAIEMYFKLQKDFPYSVAIRCKRKHLAMKLLESATPEFLEDLNDKYLIPYNIDYLIDAVSTQLNSNCKNFHQSEFGCQISPFGLG